MRISLNCFRSGSSSSCWVSLNQHSQIPEAIQASKAHPVVPSHGKADDERVLSCVSQMMHWQTQRGVN